MKHIDIDGIERHLGNNPGPLRFEWPLYGETPQAPLVPRNEWRDRIDERGGRGPESPFLSPVHDQNGQGMCNASATASALESQRLKQGLPLVQLSAGDLYWRINGGQDRGSMLEDGLAEITSEGIASVAVAPYLTRSANSPGAAEDRRKYRVLEAYLCPTFDHCLSATLMGFDLISGIPWYDNYRVDGDGWLPLIPTGNSGGHAVHGYKPTYRDMGYPVFGIWHKNSWTSRWGKNGLCVFPEVAYQRPIGGWWAIRAVVDEGGVIPPVRI
jgi:hypothetical protein